MQKVLVQSTFVRVEPVAESVADMFYTRLFELDPSLRSHFRTNLNDQGRKLMQVLSMVVHGLDRFEMITSEGADRGDTDTIVESPQAATVKAALLWTLEQVLGDGCTDKVKDAWGAAYQALAGIMAGRVRSRSYADVDHAMV
jgi:hemoglobin-like flavoprotein